MRLSITALLGFVALSTSTSPLHALPRDLAANDYYVLHLDRDASPAQVARSLGLSHEGPLGHLRDHHLFAAARAEHDVVKRGLAERKRQRRSLGDRHALDGVLFSSKQKPRQPWEKRVPPPPPAGPLLEKRAEDAPVEWAVHKQAKVAKTLSIHDPIFNEQWHLFNPVQVGQDINVTGVWLQGVTGKNTTVAIVDDGLDMHSDDLKDNYYAEGSYDFNDQSSEPRPRLADDRHGTRCAGEVSAVRNDVCGVGVAYDSRVAGLRILSKVITDADEAVAMNYDFDNNQIYSCSWGPPDDGKSMEAPSVLIKRAMLNAVQNGRQHLGSIYVFASGNGAPHDDNCNFDGYTNSIYSITVGAIDRKGDSTYYSEKCSAGLVVTYSSGGGDAIHTTDVGQNTCYNGHGGTSAAAPLAVGIFALVLEVRPDLTWRDMQYLAMDTAVPLHLDTGDWQDTSIGKKYSHTFAYGKLDSYAIVEAAKTWKNVKPQAWFFSPVVDVHQAIPEGDKGLSVSFDVTPDMLEDANFERVEHVTLTMNVEHTRRGDISVDLVSPDKVVSHLSVPRKLDDVKAGYVDWTFMSVVHWGESGLGTWTVVVKDTKINEHQGTFVDFKLNLWGESIDPDKATLLPLPQEEEEEEGQEGEQVGGGDGTTTTTGPGASQTDDSASSTTDAAHQATGTTTEAEEAPAAQTSGSTWLPSFLPTFGVSASTQAWIYGALVLIVIFCSGLAVYLWMARRKRLRSGSGRSDYEFELLDDEEAEGLNSGEKTAGLAGAGGGAGGGKRSRRTRGGELYDAFAGGSDEDEDEEDALAGTEHYRDHGPRMSEKRSSHDDDVEDNLEHHVIGSDDDEEEDDAQGGDRRPLRR